MVISQTALFTLTLLLFEHCTSVTLTRLTQQRVDAPRPSPVVLVLVTEALKLLLSACLEFSDCCGMGSASHCASLRRSVCGSPRDTLRLGVPALMYTIQNLAVYVALGNLEVVVFQLLYQSKLVLTAVLSVACLGRRLTTRQWMALVVLTVGVIAVELADAGPATALGQTTRSAATGIPAALLAAALSSSAGVYFEAIVKVRETGTGRAPPSVWVRNVQLCVFTLPIAALAAAMQWPTIRAQPFVIDAPTALLVLLNAAGGLLTAVAIKHGVRVPRSPYANHLPASTSPAVCDVAYHDPAYFAITRISIERPGLASSDPRIVACNHARIHGATWPSQQRPTHRCMQLRAPGHRTTYSRISRLRAPSFWALSSPSPPSTTARLCSSAGDRSSWSLPPTRTPRLPTRMTPLYCRETARGT